MKKRIFTNLLAAVLLVCMIAPAAFALEDTHIADGTCGEGINWSLDGYTLTITGSGEMDDGAPWQEHKNHIEHVVLTGGVTKVGAEAFYKYDRLETVDFGDALVEIGSKAFYGCEDIDYIHLPATFRIFGAQSFRECTSLRYVYCDGYMPRFNDSCLWTGNYIAVFFPTNNPWSFEYTQPLISSYGGNLGIMMGNFDESAVAENLAAIEATAPTEEETTEATQEQTEPAETTEETTVPTTEPETVPVVVTEPVTVPTTEPETEPVQTTEAETEPTTVATTVPETEAQITLFEEETEETEPAPVEEKKSNSWIGLVMIGGVLTFLISGAMIFRSVSRKNRRYRR